MSTPAHETVGTAIRVEKVTPGYWRATINNPPLNLMTREFDRHLEALVSEAEQDDQVRAIVFDTTNPDYFLAHFDVARAAEVQAIKTKSTLPVWPRSRLAHDATAGGHDRISARTCSWREERVYPCLRHIASG
jgi:enoyl-CoA hydratase/carnithine racemase